MTMLLPNFDFRDLLPVLNRRKFRLPFVASEVYDELGDKFDPLKWNRQLKKYRTKLDYKIHSEKHCDVIGEYCTEKSKISLCVILGQTIDIHHLKFLLIQTIMHEMVHANQDGGHEFQYERTNIKSDDEDLIYYSCFGEIQAYAHDAILESFNGYCITYERYSNMHENTKKEFMKQTIRWLNKYKSYGNILKEPHESNLRKHRQRS